MSHPTAEIESSPQRQLVEQAYARATGAPLVEGNRVRLLRDAEENYPAWLEAIAAARHTIHFESYIIHEDATGHEFADALIARAREGIRIRLIYDWLGGVGKTSRKFWRRLRDAGVEVRAFNPPRFSEPFGWLNRDHRKMLAVDGRVGYVTGLCVGQDWRGWPERGREPWRDTGVEVRGPAVADIEHAFSRIWKATGGAEIPRRHLPTRESLAEEGGDTAVRVIATEPNTVGMYRLEQLVAAGARERLWITDAYFVGTNTYVQALRAAAQDGVDVRLLVPSSSDIPVISAVSRANYRSLLEGGVRVFEWNGSMIHAKTAVVDGKWARVGSTNLNVASWMGNWELDVTIEDERFADEMGRCTAATSNTRPRSSSATGGGCGPSTGPSASSRAGGGGAAAGARAAPRPGPSASAARSARPSPTGGCWGRLRRASWRSRRPSCWCSRSSPSSGRASSPTRSPSSARGRASPSSSAPTSSTGAASKTIWRGRNRQAGK